MLTVTLILVLLYLRLTASILAVSALCRCYDLLAIESEKDII
jgi:hypothetical protein